MLRSATHAGSWYSDKNLSPEITQWLKKAAKNTPPTNSKHSRFIISPHAGYRFCGEVAAHSYYQLKPTPQVIVLAPLHTTWTREALTTEYAELETPLGTLNVSTDLVSQFIQCNCQFIDRKNDLLEHSFEMQLPFIKAVNPNATVTPLFLGSGNEQLESLISDLMQDPNYSFVISSDFCHYGSRFGYDFLNGTDIYKQIEKMDRDGMRAINQGSKQFVEYLESTENTICGQYPIMFLLKCAERAQLKLEFSWDAYKQSSQVRSNDDSSVSYAAGIAK